MRTTPDIFFTAIDNHVIFITIILNLLINAVAIKLGKSAEDRFERMKELGRYFREFEPLPRQPRR